MLKENLKKARLLKKWSQLDLAEKYNELVDKINIENNTNFHKIGRTAITHWETGRYSPELESIPILCELLDISSDELLDISNKDNNVLNNVKNIKLQEHDTTVSILTSEPWDKISSDKKKDLMDSIIEESIKLKKENK